MDPEHQKRLQLLWSKLIENITDIDGIVDGLYSAQVFTKSMKERVNEKSGTSRLREVLDILPKRGNKAFLAFYDVLVKCREYEAAQLLCPEKAAELRKIQVASISQEMGSLSTGLEEDDLPAKWPNLNHNPSTVDVVRVSDHDKTMKQRCNKAASGDGPCYPMSKATRGLCLIINNRNFKTARETDKKLKLQDRDGTEMDGLALKNLFQQLGFKVLDDGYQDLTAQNILAAVKDAGRQDHTYYDCFVCVVLSHGERDMLYGVDGQTVAIQELTNAVDGSRSPTLVGKPKLFFIQACQGEKKDGVIIADKDTIPNLLSSLSVSERGPKREMAERYIGDDTTTDSVSEAKVASKSDVFVASATVPDFVSWRNTRWGTWFIQAIVYIFSRQAHNKSLLEMMTNVNLLVSRAETSHGCKQVSVFTSTLKWPLYFFPGLVNGSPSPQLMYTMQGNVDVSVENKVEKAQGKGIPVDSGLEHMQTASLQPGREPSAPVQAEDTTSHSAGSSTTTPAQVAGCNVQAAISNHADKCNVDLERPAQRDQCNVDSSSAGEDLKVEKFSVNLARPAGVVTQASEQAGSSRIVW